MSTTGRKKDPVWSFFEEIKGPNNKIRAKCKKCNLNMVALVARLKKHTRKCAIPNTQGMSTAREETHTDSDESSEEELPAARKKRHIDEASFSTSATSIVSAASESQRSIENFMVRTTESEKKKIDLQIAKYIYGTNTSFRAVEHQEFKNLINILRPGYTPPTRYDVSTHLLDDVYNSVQTKVKEILLNKTVSLALDGWTNVHNEPIIAICVTDVENEQVHLVDSIDTSGHSHTAEYLLKLLKSSIKKSEDNYKCKVASIVTDSAANMSKMRNDLFRELDQKDIITYGCSAHILNLLARDLQGSFETCEVKGNIKKICKYFRNVHFASAKYKEAGGSALILPQDVRWNTLADCLESYIKNWPILYNICTENRVVLDNEIVKLVNDGSLKAVAQDYLKKLKYIAVALDKVQKKNCILSEATEVWVQLLKSFQDEHANGEFSATEVEKVQERLNMALKAPHFLANLLDHRFKGENLTQIQLDCAMEYVEMYYPETLPTIINFRANSTPFKKYMFSKQLIDNVKPLAWWRSFNCLDPVTLNLVQQLHTAVASSADIERIFSSFGLVHSHIRNRLGNEKAAKLVSIFKELNNK